MSRVLRYGLMMVLLSAAVRAETVVPRTVVMLYDGQEHSGPRDTTAHRFAEMPLNHLGFVVEYHDAHQPLPPLHQDVHAVMSWFNPGTEISDSPRMLQWFEQALDDGKKLIIFGTLGVETSYRNTAEGLAHIRRVLRRIGVEDHDSWFNVTYRAEVVDQDKQLTDFERSYSGNLPGYYHTTVYGERARSHLRLKNYTNTQNPVHSDLIITHPGGAYVADGYAKFEVVEGRESRIRQWRIDPFTFFDRALQAAHRPRPDNTTLNGRRIFYSHMDGDGWNNLSEVDGYNQRKTLSAEVLRREVFEPYTGIPFSVGIIVNEMKTNCYGLPQSRAAAKRIFALPNVEPTSHTYSHPLYWHYFADGDAQKERRFLHLYPPKPNSSRSIYSALHNWLFSEEDGWQSATAYGTQRPERNRWLIRQSQPEVVTAEGVEDSPYETPRSYACQPFDIETEIQGSVAYVQKLAPPGKEVRLIQWSGNTAPFEEAIQLANEINVLNINGGDTRLDREYPSYAYVSPIGLQVGNARQIYSSNSNENTYTNLWTDRFFGFKFLTRTARNTETPRRITPFNVYFHTYSGSKQPSLEAIKVNLDYALSQDIIPIFTSEYAAIANDFYHTKLVKLRGNRWRVEDRGRLNTIRFDHATLKQVDWEHSEGVIGQRHLHGSLYVALEPNHEAPVIAIKPARQLRLPADAPRPYLIRSRWKIKDLHYFNNLLTFAAEGLGPGGMEWYWPDATQLAVTIRTESRVLSDRLVTPDADGIWRIDADIEATTPVDVRISPLTLPKN